MLSVLRVIDQHRSGAASMPLAATIERKDFKIIYVYVFIHYRLHSCRQR